MLPSDWRERLVAMIRGAEPVRDDWFTGGPVCTPREQIEIYCNQYRLRLYDALLVEVPGLQHLIRDDPAAEELLRRYLSECPSASWTLNRVADRLAPWLAEQPGVPRRWVEMARLDRAVQAGFEAAEGLPIDPGALATMPRLRLQPHVSLLRLRTNVHDLRAAVLTGAPVPADAVGDWPLVVYRAGLGMRHLVVPAGMWAILEAVGRGASVPEAIDAAFTAGHADAATLEANLAGWFRQMAECRLVGVA